MILIYLIAIGQLALKKIHYNKVVPYRENKGNQKKFNLRIAMFQNNKIYKNLVCVRQIEINLNSDNSLSRLLKNINNKNKKQKINEQ